MPPRQPGFDPRGYSGKGRTAESLIEAADLLVAAGMSLPKCLALCFVHRSLSSKACSEICGCEGGNRERPTLSSF
jgi:hypothetical protein